MPIYLKIRFCPFYFKVFQERGCKKLNVVLWIQRDLFLFLLSFPAGKHEGRDFCPAPQKKKSHIIPDRKLKFSLLGIKKKIILFQTFSLNMHIFIFMSFNNKNGTLTVTWEQLTLVVVFLWMMILAPNCHLHDVSNWLQYIFQLQLRLSHR